MGAAKSAVGGPEPEAMEAESVRPAPRSTLGAAKSALGGPDQQLHRHKPARPSLTSSSLEAHQRLVSNETLPPGPTQYRLSLIANLSCIRQHSGMATISTRSRERATRSWTRMAFLSPNTVTRWAAAPKAATKQAAAGLVITTCLATGQVRAAAMTTFLMR